jgi:hypothetical protein
MKERCIDPTVGDILSGWRYDISGLYCEMRSDYEAHLRDCSHCLSRQRLHRAIDVLLIVGLTGAVVAFFSSVLVLAWMKPLRDWVVLNLHIERMSLVINLELLAITGLLMSVAAWIVVAIITPAPIYLSQQARALQEKLPEELRERLARRSA